MEDQGERREGLLSTIQRASARSARKKEAKMVAVLRIDGFPRVEMRAKTRARKRLNGLT